MPRISFFPAGPLSYEKECLSLVIWGISLYQFSQSTWGCPGLKGLSPQHISSSEPFVLSASVELSCLPLEPAGIYTFLGLYDIGIFPFLPSPTRNYLFVTPSTSFSLYYLCFLLLLPRDFFEVLLCSCKYFGFSTSQSVLQNGTPGFQILSMETTSTTAKTNGSQISYM